MRLFVTAVLASSILLGAPSASVADDLDVVRVRKLDGSVVPGFVLEKRDEGLLVRTGEGDLFIPWVEIGEVEHIESPVEPSTDAIHEEPQPTPRQPTPPPALRYDTAQELRSHPAWAAYDSRRMRLVNKDGRAIGPARLGFPSRDFRRDDDRRFHAQLGSRIIDVPEFLELAQSDELMIRWERQIDKAETKAEAGSAFLVVSGSLAAVGWPLAIAGANNGDFTAAFVGPGLIGWSVATTVIAGLLHKSGFGRLRELTGPNLEEFIDRPDAWPHVQDHNAGVRAETGLPESEQADAQ